MSPAETLDGLIVDELQADLGDTLIGREVIVLQQTGSTNDAILEVARDSKEGAQHLAIVGVGINVNHSSQDFPSELQGRAISLAMALDRQIDRQKFAAAVLRSLDRTYREIFSL